MELRRICQEILEEARKSNIRDLRQFARVKLRVLGRLNYEKIPKNAAISSLLSEKDGHLFNKILSMKPVRTISGVAPIALMTDPYPCPHTVKGIGPCTYCPGGPGSPFGDVPQSYTGKEPSTRRAIRNNYDPYIGVFNRLEHYIVMCSVPEKTEVILQGGTFCFFPYPYQEYFVKYLLKAMNDFSRLFYDGSGINKDKFNEFFEMPADIDCKERTERIHKKLLFIKNLDLINEKILEGINYLFFDKNIDLFNNKNNNNININGNFNENPILKNRNLFNETIANPNIAAIKNTIKKVNEQNNAEITLAQVQKENETSRIRCVGLTIETKSDYGKLFHGSQMLNLGCTRVEIGVQSIYDYVLEKTNRGNTVKDNTESIGILKDLGFKINLHYMPGLPYTTREMDKNGLRELFDNPDYRPDMLKIYPCMVMQGTKLYDEWKAGRFNPLTAREAAEMIAWFKQFVPKYCRIMRIQRDIPTYTTSAGVDRTNLRQYVERFCNEKNIKCSCIRCREIGHKLHLDKDLEIKKPEIIVFEYKASNGREFFISYEDLAANTLLGFCRLRFPYQFLRQEIAEGSALIRELHVFGTALSIGRKGNKKQNNIQHTGIGKMLMKKAEEITFKNNKNKVVVISGIGAREYFRMLGYRLEGVYMVKDI